MKNTLKNIYTAYNIERNLPNEFIDIVTNPQNYTLEEKRVLSIDEIVDAEKDMLVNFSALKIIPVIDCFDNDYICYDFNNETWLVFNTVDEISFKQTKTLNELIKK